MRKILGPIRSRSSSLTGYIEMSGPIGTSDSVGFPREVSLPGLPSEVAAGTRVGQLQPLIQSHPPQLGGVVRAAGGQPATIGAEGQGMDWAHMAAQYDWLVIWRFHIPQPDRGIFAAGRQLATIRAVRQCGDPILIADQHIGLSPILLHIPQLLVSYTVNNELVRNITLLRVLTTSRSLPASKNSLLYR